MDNSEPIEEKISLDELYDRKREVELHRLGIYRKILSRVHTKIKMVARQKINNDYLFYIVPEVIFGFPKYNLNDCIAFLIEKLQENGFHIKYTHPNLLFICWNHYIPSYEREKIKQLTGKTIDGFGNVIKESKGKNNMSLKSSLGINTLNNSNSNSNGNGSGNININDIDDDKKIQLPHKLLSNSNQSKYDYHINKQNYEYKPYYTDDDYNNNQEYSRTNQEQKKNVKFKDISTYKPTGIYNKELMEIINKKFNS